MLTCRCLRERAQALLAVCGRGQLNTSMIRSACTAVCSAVCTDASALCFLSVASPPLPTCASRPTSAPGPSWHSRQWAELTQPKYGKLRFECYQRSSEPLPSSRPGCVSVTTASPRPSCVGATARSLRHRVDTLRLPTRGLGTSWLSTAWRSICATSATPASAQAAVSTSPFSPARSSF
jgi:hypothetical protein